jgi:biotin carboxyl carrier protein
MKLEIEIGGRTRALEVRRVGKRLLWQLDGRAIEADVLEVARGIYSVLIEGQSHEVRVEEAGVGLRVFTANEEYLAEVVDPRQWRKRHGGAHPTEGSQQVLAPMPGKVVRVLVKTGDTVKAGQGIVVVEAMKMQNEIRAPRPGTVERLLVTEGQAVNSGEVLAVVT